MSNVNELVARLRVLMESDEYEIHQEYWRRAADQIEADQKRIAELQRRHMNLLAQVAGIEGQRIAAAEAMKEAAAKVAVEHWPLAITEAKEAIRKDCADAIRAMSCADVIERMKS